MSDLVEKVAIPSNEGTMLQLASIMEKRALEAEAKLAAIPSLSFEEAVKQAHYHYVRALVDGHTGLFVMSRAIRALTSSGPIMIMPEGK